MRLLKRSLAIAALVGAATVFPVTNVVTGHMPLVEACSGYQLLNSAPVYQSGTGYQLGTIKLWQNCGDGKIHADMQNDFPYPQYGNGSDWVYAELNYYSEYVPGQWTRGSDSDTPEMWGGHTCYTALGTVDDPGGTYTLGTGSTTACV